MLILFPLYVSAPFMFVLGVVVGSFLNVVILRYEKEERLTGRSYCPHCKKKLTWYELIPIVSYLIQFGRCRGCKSSVSIQYPLVEFITGCVFVGVAHTIVPLGEYVSLSILPVLILHVVIWCLLIVMTVYDLRTMLIPDRFSYTFAFLALMLIAISHPTNPEFISYLIAGPILFLPFYVLWKASHGCWMGLGDGKLALGMGWYLGLLGGVSAVMFAFWIGAFFSLLMIAYERIGARYFASHTTMHSFSSEVPFGPYLIIGTAIVFFGGFTVLTLVA